MTEMHSHRRLIGLAAGAALLFASASVFAADRPAPAGSHAALSEMEIAQVHTGYAADATSLESLRSHLQHAKNCLVGPGGAGYDAAVDNPCAAAGAGVVVDTHDPLRASLADTALDQVDNALAANSLDAARQFAREATNTLRLAAR